MTPGLVLQRGPAPAPGVIASAAIERPKKPKTNGVLYINEIAFSPEGSEHPNPKTNGVSYTIDAV